MSNKTISNHILSNIIKSFLTIFKFLALKKGLYLQKK